MTAAGQQWTTDKIREECERKAEQERLSFCPDKDNLNKLAQV
jgi:hypothetical protein